MRPAIISLCVYALSSVCLFAAENPLIERELFPLANPSFEEGSVHWSHGNEIIAGDGKTACKIVETAVDGKKSLAMQLDEWVDPGALFLERAFMLEEQGSVYVGLKIRTQGEVHANMQVSSSNRGTVSSPRIEPDSDWQEVGIVLDAPAAGSHELKLKAFGQGKVYFDDIKVYALNPYSQYIRVKLDEPASDRYRLYVWTRMARPREYFHKTYFAEEGVAPGEYSPWIHLNEGDEFSGSPVSIYPGLISAGIRFQKFPGGKFEHIKAHVQLAYGPDEDKIIGTISEDNEGHIVGIFFARTGAGPFEFVKQFRPMLDDARERNSLMKSLNLPPVRIKHFMIETAAHGHDSFYSDPRFIEYEQETLSMIGINALSHLYSPYRQIAAKEGITRTHESHRESILYELPKLDDDEFKEAIRDPMYARAIEMHPPLRDLIESGWKPTRMDWADLKRNISRAVGAWFIRMKNHDAEAIPLIEFVDIGDEISGVVFAGKGFNEGYRAFLKERGLKPQDVGKDSWEDVVAITWGAYNHPLPHMRPKDRSDVAACRHYYWSLKYWTDSTAKVYGTISRELEKRMPWIHTRVNFGQPWYNAATDMRGTDCWEFARQRTITAPCNEDWLSASGAFSGIQLNAYLADLDRSCAAIHDMVVQAYVMPEDEDHIQRKLASVIGKGVKEIDLFSYGPAYSSFDNWSQNFSQATGVAKFLRKLEKAEDVLFPGQPRKPKVAMIWSASDEIWREKAPVQFDSHMADSLYNRHYVYFGLLHKQIPIDFIDEVEIQKGRLSEYEIVYLSARNLRRDVQKTVADWVRGGGYLWTDALSGVEDEYGQQSEILLPVIGIKDLQITESSNVDYRPHASSGLKRQEPLDSITFKDTGEALSAIGTTVKFTLSEPEKTKILAAFSDGSPAVIEREYGKGKVQYVGTLAGCSYGWTTRRRHNQIVTGYKEVNRRLIADFPERVGVKMPLSCSVPMVEADLLESDKGIGIVLANYAGEDPLEKIRLDIAVPKKISSVMSAKRGVVPFTYNDDSKSVEVTLPLEIVDMLVLK
jgi:hypothetical protein